MRTSLEDCLFCKKGPIEHYTFQNDTHSYRCDRCGWIKITGTAASSIGASRYDPVRHLLSGYTRELTEHQKPPLVFTSNNIQDRADLGRLSAPRNALDKLDKILLYLEKKSRFFGDSIRFDSQKDYPIVYAKHEHPEELHHLLQALEDRGDIRPTATKDSFTLTPSGVSRLAEIHKAMPSSDQCFIAMWFDSSTIEYRKAVRVAVEYCGYKPVIVDQEEFSGFIMDQVVTSIRQAHFLIADFSCKPEIDDLNEPRTKNGSRGGVYWEAGMAYGLGKTVIHTCMDNGDARRRIHFDVDQYVTMFWRPEELSLEIRDPSQPIHEPTFAERLVSRILYVVGRGTYTPDSDKIS